MKKIIHLILQVLIVLTTYILGSIYIQTYWLIFLPGSIVALIFPLLALFQRKNLSLLKKIVCLFLSLLVYLPSIYIFSLWVSHDAWAYALIAFSALLIIINLLYWLIIEIGKKKGNLRMYSYFILFSLLVMLVGKAYFLYLLFA